MKTILLAAALAALLASPSHAQTTVIFANTLTQGGTNGNGTPTVSSFDGSLTLNNGAIGTIQDIRTVAAPTFAGLTITTGGNTEATVRSTSASNYAALVIKNTGASGKSYSIIVGGPSFGIAALQGAWGVFDNDGGGLRLWVDSSGNTNIGQNLIVPTSAPATSSSAGVAGTITWDNGYVYVCVSTNTWKRAALSTF